MTVNELIEILQQYKSSAEVIATFHGAELYFYINQTTDGDVLIDTHSYEED